MKTYLLLLYTLRRNSFIIVLILLLALLLMIISCEKRDFKSVAKVETKTVSEIMATTVKATGGIIDLGDGITDHGHCWGIVSKLSISDSVTHLGAAEKTGTYTSELKNLVPGKTYYTRAYAKIKDEVIYGDTIKFTTLGPPSLTTTAATAITSFSATLGGNVTADGRSAVTDRGVYWRASNNTDTTWIKFSMGEGKGPFSNSLSGLTPNNLYYFKAYATNSVTTTYGAKLSFTTILGAPTNVSAQAGDAKAIITFTAPVNNGGSAITGYSVTSSPGGFTATGSASPITVTGLTNGTAYTFTVVATNANGTGSSSSASNPVIPSTVPGAPTIGAAIAENEKAMVTYTAPVDNGGSAITGYTVTSSPGGFKGTGSTSPITVTGLTNGTAYTFTVVATNANGHGSSSSISNLIIPLVSLAAIGDSYQGGKIAYILQPGDPGYINGETHGLIAAISDQSIGIQWYNGSNTTIGATATELGAGKANTNTIVASQGEGSYAAKLCYDLVLEGYNDWYLPSKDELYKLYWNGAAIGGFVLYWYWSSSEVSNSGAWSQFFYARDQYQINDKFYPFYVRAVRSF